MRRLRETGGENIEQRAKRLGEVALAGWLACGESLDPGAVVGFFMAGYFAGLGDVIEVAPPDSGSTRAVPRNS